MTNSSHKRAAKSGWGGKRAGAGRKPGPDASVSKVTTVVLTEVSLQNSVSSEVRNGFVSKYRRAELKKFPIQILSRLFQKIPHWI